LHESEEVLWNPENSSEDIPATTTGGLLRTPNAYGYFSLVYNPIEALALSYSGVFTGSMNVPRVVDVETERTIIETTPTFIENNLKIAYAFQEEKQFDIEFFGGVQNIFNSYQNDFDSGADRDAGYVYGPMRPRTFFIGLKYGLE
jgi:outer membrane receptor for ferrienterochelin and colicins